MDINDFNKLLEENGNEILIQRSKFFGLFLGLIEHDPNISYEAKINHLNLVTKILVDHPTELDSPLHEAFKAVFNKVESDYLLTKALKGL